MKCNFSVDGYCHRTQGGGIKCNGDTDRKGCPGWRLIEAIRSMETALKGAQA